MAEFSQPSRVYAVALSQDGAYALTGGSERAFLWDTSEKVLLREINLPPDSFPTFAAFSHSGELVLVGTSNPPTFSAYSVAKGKKMKQVSSLLGRGNYFLAVSPQNDAILIGNGRRFNCMDLHAEERKKVLAFLAGSHQKLGRKSLARMLPTELGRRIVGFIIPMYDDSTLLN